jgi:putative membrane protein
MNAQASSLNTGTELAMRQTGMAFQRTRMSADRTLMAVIRTSLSLISFGFTISQVFKKLQDAGVLRGVSAARNFGASLVLLGVGMLALGIAYHVWYMWGLRQTRDEMRLSGLIHAQSIFPASLPLITALSLLGIGVFAAISIVLRSGPFG